MRNDQFITLFSKDAETRRRLSLWNERAGVDGPDKDMYKELYEGTIKNNVWVDIENFRRTASMFAKDDNAKAELIKLVQDCYKPFDIGPNEVDIMREREAALDAFLSDRSKCRAPEEVDAIRSELYKASSTKAQVNQLEKDATLALFLASQGQDVEENQNILSNINSKIRDIESDNDMMYTVSEIEQLHEMESEYAQIPNSYWEQLAMTAQEEDIRDAARDVADIEASLEDALARANSAVDDFNDAVMNAYAVSQKAEHVENNLETIVNAIDTIEFPEGLSNEEKTAMKDVIAAAWKQVASPENTEMKVTQATTVLDHPFNYAAFKVKETLKDIKDEYKASKDVLDAAGVEYQSSLKKVAEAIAMPVSGVFTLTKNASLNVFRTGLEKTAGLYNNVADKFAELTSKAAHILRIATYQCTRAIDMGLNYATLGTWAKISEKIAGYHEKQAQDYVLRKEGLDIEHGHVQQGASLRDAALEGNAPLAIREMAKLEEFIGMKSSPTSGLRAHADKFLNGVDRMTEGVGYIVTKGAAMHRQQTAKEYWNEIKSNTWGEKSPMDYVTDKLGGIHDFINEKYIKPRNAVVDAVETKTVNVAKTCAEFCKDTLFPSVVQAVKDAPSNVKEFATKTVPQKMSAVGSKIASLGSELDALKEVKKAELGVASCEFMSYAAGKVADITTKIERKADVTVAKLKTTDETLFSKIQNIQKEIDELSSAKYERKEYVPNQELANMVSLLEQQKDSLKSTEKFVFEKCKSVLESQKAKFEKQENKAEKSFQKVQTEAIKELTKELDKLSDQRESALGKLEVATKALEMVTNKKEAIQNLSNNFADKAKVMTVGNVQKAAAEAEMAKETEERDEV